MRRNKYVKIFILFIFFAVLENKCYRYNDLNDIKTIMIIIFLCVYMCARAL